MLSNYCHLLEFEWYVSTDVYYTRHTIIPISKKYCFFFFLGFWALISCVMWWPGNNYKTMQKIYLKGVVWVNIVLSATHQSQLLMHTYKRSNCINIHFELYNSWLSFQNTLQSSKANYVYLPQASSHRLQTK